MQNLTDDKIKWLEKKANDIRESIIESLIEAGSGHSGGPLGMADIFTALYFHIMKHVSILVPEGECSITTIEGTYQILLRVNDWLEEAQGRCLKIVEGVPWR